MRILIACEESGRVRDAFIKRGHNAVSCDLLPSRSDKGPHYQGDVRDILGDGWDMMIAHPPCTRLTNTGVRWLKAPPNGRTLESMWDELREDAAFYCLLRDAPIHRKAIENPIMHGYARELVKLGNRQLIQPWWFGDPAFKGTGLELYNLPPLVPTNKLTPPKKGTREHTQWSISHLMSPSTTRTRDRSVTYQGIADAMADQWGKLQ